MNFILHFSKIRKIFDKIQQIEYQILVKSVKLLANVATIAKFQNKFDEIFVLRESFGIRCQNGAKEDTVLISANVFQRVCSI